MPRKARIDAPGALHHIIARGIERCKIFRKDAYLLELVRYIHLNPLRAGLVKDLGRLERYAFSGHGAIMGKFDHPWQNVTAVLSLFSQSLGPARRSYRDFVAKGVDQGRRDDLMGGGLVRSAGGWTAVKAMRKADIHIKSDERILGDGAFVTGLLSNSQDGFDDGYALQNRGIDIEYAAKRVARLMEMPLKDLWQPGKQRRLVAARSLLCYWAVRKLGLSMTAMARRLGISTVAVSKSVDRGALLAEENGYQLLES